MATNSANPLAELKPLHLPPEVSWWPPAIGWYLLLAVVIVMLVIAWWRYRKYCAAKRLRQTITEQWLAIENEYLANPSPEVLATVNVFLKRVAVKYYPEEKPQLLTGNEWLIFLDKSGKTSDFSKGSGKLLANPYCRTELSDCHELFAVIRSYLKVVL